LTWIKEPWPGWWDIRVSRRTSQEDSVKRKIIHIDDSLCNGCGQCIPGCPEGALQLIDGKARLVSDLFCDGLGACIGECPMGAIRIEEREAQVYDERKAMENIVRQGEGTIRAHLAHLRQHGEQGYLGEALAVLEEKGLKLSLEAQPGGHSGHSHPQGHGGCPGARVMEFEEPPRSPAGELRPPRGELRPPAGELRQWPVQLHLIPPSAPYFRDADVLLAADCVAYAYGDFHRQLLAGRRLAIACPKLDSNQDIYLDKLVALIEHSGIRSLTVATMEVPCCGGLLALVRKAAAQARRSIPISWLEIGVQGQVLQQEAAAV
jgi:ferredoxin